MRCSAKLVVERWTGRRKCPHGCKRVKLSPFAKRFPHMYDKKLMAELREQLYLVYGHSCMKCGDQRRICLEHIVSRAIGGTNNLDNLQLLCWWCNAEKGLKIADYRPDDWEALIKGLSKNVV